MSEWEIIFTVIALALVSMTIDPSAKGRKLRRRIKGLFKRKTRKPKPKQRKKAKANSSKSVSHGTMEQVLVGQHPATLGELERNKNLPIVYIVQNGHGNYKVGRTTHAKGRLSAFRTANDTTITFIGALHGGRELEAVLHDVLEPCQTETKNEWFHDCNDIQTLIKFASFKDAPTK